MKDNLVSNEARIQGVNIVYQQKHFYFLLPTKESDFIPAVLSTHVATTVSFDFDALSLPECSQSVPGR